MPKTGPNAIEKRHDKAGRKVHRLLYKKYYLECADRWYQHNPEPVTENEEVKLLWAVTIQTDRVIEHRRPGFATLCFATCYTSTGFPTLMRSSVIYKFQCPGCHASYYGKTSRNLITRCREHLGVNKAGFRIKGGPSAIGDHINQSGHAASFKDFSILDRANNEFDLLIHESLLILRDRPELNSQQSSIPLVLL